MANDSDGSLVIDSAETKITDVNGNPLTLTVVDTDSCTKVTHGTVDLEIYYYLNDSLVDYQLVSRLHNGPHILSLFYPFAELKGDTNNTWEVCIRCESGSVTVAKRALKATVTGQGLAATTVWDGTITIEEVVSAINLTADGIMIGSIVDSVSTDAEKPATNAIETILEAVELVSLMQIGEISDEMSVDPVVEKLTISPSQLTKWTYSDRYVELGESGVQLKTSWTYQSVEQTIDSGSLTAVKATTSDLTSVISLEVSTT